MDMADSQNTNGSSVLLEQGKRLSESLIWRLQRDFFEQQGVEAWRQSTVPHYITSNPTVARTYAEIVFGFLRDRAAISSARCSGSQPIYLVELGAGSGRLAYHFLKKLGDLCSRTPFRMPEYRYVLTDLPARNLDFWRQHPRLQPFVEQGLLDFAPFDAEKDDMLKLETPGETIQPGSLAQPVVVIANYFFDSIPQDLFYFEDGKLFECRISLRSPFAYDKAMPAELLEHMKVEYDYHSVELPYYGNIYLDGLLDEYRQTLNENYRLFPHVGLHCLDRLKSLSGEGLMLLSADKGYHSLEDLTGRSTPSIVRHGSVSLLVNFHSIRRFCEMQGGLALFSGRRHLSLDVACLLMLPDAERYAETRLAHSRVVEEFSPDDFFSIKKHFEQSINGMAFQEVLAYLRLSGHDPHLFIQLVPRLHELLPGISAPERRELLEAISEVWDIYYPIGEAQDLAFDMGTLLYQLDEYEDALTYFRHSIGGYGPRAATLTNMALCQYMLGDMEAARASVESALAQAPDNEAALALKREMEKALE
jgi:tetratricopeptide (TPR) repeat protein